jgi:hypothetical protein
MTCDLGCVCRSFAAQGLPASAEHTLSASDRPAVTQSADQPGSVAGRQTVEHSSMAGGKADVLAAQNGHRWQRGRTRAERAADRQQLVESSSQDVSSHPGDAVQYIGGAMRPHHLLA